MATRSVNLKRLTTPGYGSPVLKSAAATYKYPSTVASYALPPLISDLFKNIPSVKVYSPELRVGVYDATVIVAVIKLGISSFFFS